LPFIKVGGLNIPLPSLDNDDLTGGFEVNVGAHLVAPVRLLYLQYSMLGI